MPTEIILLVLRVISGLLLLLFLAAIFRVLRRDQMIDFDISKRHYGYLVVLQEIDGQYHLTGEQFALKAITSLGRSPTNTVPITDNFASSEHALVTLRQGQWWLEDRNSRNGTFLNNIQIKQPIVIAQGDIIGIGQFRLRVDLD